MKKLLFTLSLFAAPFMACASTYEKELQSSLKGTHNLYKSDGATAKVDRDAVLEMLNSTAR